MLIAEPNDGSYAPSEPIDQKTLITEALAFPWLPPVKTSCYSSHIPQFKAPIVRGRLELERRWRASSATARGYHEAL